jgi:thiol:disulfide interchange protein DsbC
MNKTALPALLSGAMLRMSLGVGLSLALSLTACADSVESTIKKTLQKHLGAGAPIESITKTPYSGLYEVKIGAEIVYTDAEGKYLFIGRVVEAETSKDMTEARLEEVNKIKFADLPLDLATKTVRGNGKRVVAVFEDPNCGYCKRFRKTLAEMNDITVYTFMYPILGEDSKTKVKNAWCAADRAKAWDDWMLNGKVPAAAPSSCTAAANDKVVEMGRKLGVSGTPTVFFADCTRVPGALDAKKLEAKLALVK